MIAKNATAIVNAAKTANVNAKTANVIVKIAHAVSNISTPSIPSLYQGGFLGSTIDKGRRAGL